MQIRNQDIRQTGAELRPVSRRRRCNGTEHSTSSTHQKDSLVVRSARKRTAIYGNFNRPESIVAGCSGNTCHGPNIRGDVNPVVVKIVISSSLNTHPYVVGIIDDVDFPPVVWIQNHVADVLSTG